MVRSSLLTWTHAVVLLHQLSSSALRKEVSGYKCCDVIVFGFSAFIRVCICIAVAYVLFIYFLTSCVASSRLQKWRCCGRDLSQYLKPWLLVYHLGMERFVVPGSIPLGFSVVSRNGTNNATVHLHSRTEVGVPWGCTGPRWLSGTNVSDHHDV